MNLTNHTLRFGSPRSRLSTLGSLSLERITWITLASIHSCRTAPLRLTPPSSSPSSSSSSSLARSLCRRSRTARRPDTCVGVLVAFALVGAAFLPLRLAQLQTGRRRRRAIRLTSGRRARASSGRSPFAAAAASLMARYRPRRGVASRRQLSE